MIRGPGPRLGLGLWSVQWEDMNAAVISPSLLFLRGRSLWSSRLCISSSETSLLNACQMIPPLSLVGVKKLAVPGSLLLTDSLYLKQTSAFPPDERSCL